MMMLKCILSSFFLLFHHLLQCNAYENSCQRLLKNYYTYDFEIWYKIKYVFLYLSIFFLSSKLLITFFSDLMNEFLKCVYRRLNSTVYNLFWLLFPFFPFSSCHSNAR